MAESSTPSTSTGTKPTLGLTGLTSNAMALIAPGAFLWLTFGIQVLTGAPAAGSKERRPLDVDHRRNVVHHQRFVRAQ